MNDIVITNGTEQMVSTIIGLLSLLIIFVITSIYNKLKQYEKWKKIFTKLKFESKLFKELVTDIKNETTTVAKKQGIKKVREKNIHILDDVNIDTIAKYEKKAEDALNTKLERNTDDNSTDREGNRREIQDSPGGQDSSTSHEPHERIESGSTK